MADRNRVPNIGRTPEAFPPDTIEQGFAQRDLADFAPSLKAGAKAGTALAVDASGVSLQTNGDYSTGVSDWTPTSTTLFQESGAGNVLSGTYSMKVLGGSAFYHATSPISKLPLGAVALKLDTNILSAETNGIRVRPIIYWVDEAGAQHANHEMADRVSSPGQWIGVAGYAYVPTSFDCQGFYIDYLITGVNGATPTSPLYIDITNVTVANTYDGMHSGQASFSAGVVNLGHRYQSDPGGFSNSVINTYEELMGSPVTMFFPDKTQPLDVCVTATVRAGSTGATGQNMRFRVGVSIDGGSTFTYSPQDIGFIGGAGSGDGAQQQSSLTALVGLSNVLATGDIEVSLQGKTDAGTPANYTWADFQWRVDVCPHWVDA